MHKRIGILFLLLVITLLAGLLAVAPATTAAPACRQPDSPDGANGILCPKPSPTPNPSPTNTPTPSPTSTPTPLPTFTPTPQPTDTPTPTPTFTPTPRPTNIPSATPAMMPSLTPTPTFTPTETAVPQPTPAATPPGNPEQQGGHGNAPTCARFNLDMGRNGRTGATIPGRYEMIEVGTGRLLAQWEAQANWTCSPWLDNIQLSFKEGSWVEIFFYPEGENTPVKLEILNPAPGTPYGWLAPGMCHAIELQFPEG